MKEIADKIRQILVSQGKTLSTAESCTSGRIAAALTCVDGSSKYFQGGLVAYQDALKTRMLGVPAEMIKKHDVVSQPVVEAMVKGACQLFGTDYALASTGYAGEGANGIPSGTIWIAWGTIEDVHSCCLCEQKGREENTTNAVLQVLTKFLESL